MEPSKSAYTSRSSAAEVSVADEGEGYVAGLITLTSRSIKRGGVLERAKMDLAVTAMENMEELWHSIMIASNGVLN